MRWPRLRLKRPEPDPQLGWHWFGNPAQRHFVLINPMTGLPEPVCGTREAEREIVRAATSAFDCAECAAYWNEVYFPQIA